MEKVPLYQLVEMCKKENEQAKKEYKRRFGFDWDALIKKVSTKK
jgi:hypothetical protein